LGVMILLIVDAGGLHGAGDGGAERQPGGGDVAAQARRSRVPHRDLQVLPGEGNVIVIAILILICSLLILNLIRILILILTLIPSSSPGRTKWSQLRHGWVAFTNLIIWSNMLTILT
jgi:hypothetical protein